MPSIPFLRSGERGAEASASAPYLSPWGTTDKVVLPQKEEEEALDGSSDDSESIKSALADFADLTGAPGSGLRKYKAFPPRRGWDYNKHVFQLARNRGHQIVNHAEDQGRLSRDPTPEELGEVLESVIYERFGTWVVTDYEVGTGNTDSLGLTDRDAARIARDAAKSILGFRTRGYLALQRARGKKGGGISKRKPKFTVADLADFASLKPAEQARALGVSVRTVQRIHEREHKQQ